MDDQSSNEETGRAPSRSAEHASSLASVGAPGSALRAGLIPHVLSLPPDDHADAAQIWATIREHSRLILGTGAIVFVAVMTWTLTSRMVFESSGRLYLGEVGSSRGAETDLAGGDEGDLVSEIEILGSQSMVERAILAAGLNVSVVPSGWTPPRFWRWLIGGRDPALLDVAATQVLVSDSELAPGVVEPQAYTVKFTSEDDYELTGEDGAKVRGELGRTLKLRSLTLNLRPGTAKARRTGAEFELTVVPLADVFEAAKRALVVSAPKAAATTPTKVVALAFRHTSPRGAAEFVQALMDGYLAARQSWKTENASAAEAFVTAQLRSMRESLDAAQEKLAEFRVNNPGVVLESEGAAMVQQIAKYEEQRVAARLEVAALRDISRALKRPGASLEAYMFGEASDAVLQQQAQSLVESQQRLAELEASFRNTAPNVQEQRSQVDAQRASIASYVSSRVGRAEESLRALNGVIGSFEAKLKTVPGAELGLAQIARESEVYSKMYSFLLEQQQQAAIAKASTVSKNRILDRPRVQRREDSPSLLVRLASSLFGLLLGTAFVVLRSLLSGRMRTEQEARAVLGPTPVFAGIPKQLGRARGAGNRRSLPLYDVTAPDADFGFAEGFRMLRTNLYRRLPTPGGKIILVTSPSPGDGKTTCVLSLAAMLAADANRVLVVDADLRKPTHHILTGQPLEPGLQGLLGGTNETEGSADAGGRASRIVSWPHVVHTVQLSFGRFHSISAGAGARPDLLSKRSLATLLQRARGRYDFILLDTPSFPLVSDALILAPLCDFVLTVVRARNTPRKLALRHLQGIFPVASGHAAVINNAERANEYGYHAHAHAQVHAVPAAQRIGVIQARDEGPL